MRKALVHAAMATVLALTAAGSAAAAPPSAMPANSAAARDDWWKHAVIYELYPRSFADSNNDGIGDLKGIAQHMDYLGDLGVDAIWLTPMFPSPQADFGYDVADYNDVDPQFGTVAGADQLIAGGKRQGIKLILDFVINHTSDKHPWFVQSRASRTNPYRDFYIWRDGKADGTPPNNWTSLFGGSAWDKDPTTGQYYYHFFYPQQPDLNWRNPKVEKAMFDAAEWWLKRGVYGYRLDAVGTMFEREDLKDNPPAPGKDAYGLPNQDRVNNTELPEVHTELQRLRQQVIDRYPGRILIGETYVGTSAELTKFYGAHNDEVQLPMFLSLIGIRPLTAAQLRPRIEAVENNAVGGWPCFALNNHDQRRVPSRYDLPAGTTGDDMARITAALLLTLRGTPILYYGEELGMQNNDPERVEDVQDIIGKKGWPIEKGRDGERTPMQWDASANAGFNTGAKPWLPVGPDYATRNVAAERKDPNSVLNFYRTLIAERRSNPALAGDMAMVDRSNPDVLSYVRSGGGKKVLTVLNFGGAPKDVSFAQLGGGKAGRVIARSRADLSGAGVHLAPLGVLVIELS
jgi:alpha-glucosidase